MDPRFRIQAHREPGVRQSVTEIMINGTQSIYYEKEGRLHLFDARFESDDQIRVLIDRIVGPLGRRIDESSPDGQRASAPGSSRQRDHPRRCRPMVPW